MSLRGGLERVDLSGGVGSITSSIVVDDGFEPIGYLYGGAIVKVAVIDASLGYLFFRDEYDLSGPVYKTHPFDPSSGSVDTLTTLLDGSAVYDMVADSNGDLFVVATDGLYEIRRTDYHITGPIDVGTNPVDLSVDR